jgi:hypothetical protein
MFDELVGKRVLFVEFPCETTLIFHTADGVFHYDADADCCSESWVESISDVSIMHDAAVREIRTKRLDLAGTRQDEDSVDFVSFVTDKGYFDVEFRNSSNGYYGGEMVLVAGLSSALRK